MTGLIIRFIVSALVLFLTSLVVPGFRVVGFGGVIMAAMIITVIGYVIEKVFGNEKSWIGRGLLEFVTTAVVIYSVQFIIPGIMQASIVGALLATLIIEIVNSFVTIKPRETEIKKPNFFAAQDLGTDMEVAAELVQQKDKSVRENKPLSD